jgi:CTP:phosphocholine cytidylyltransferase-like protein
MKFCILAAGKGTRNQSIRGLHKALLPLDNKAVISHIIEKLHEDTEVVVAVGYQADQVVSYLNLTHPNRKITFVEVDNYDGEGSGPGYSLLCCKQELQCPFVFTSADTLIQESPSFESISENWIGYDWVRTGQADKYCLLAGEAYLNKLYYQDVVIGDLTELTKAYIGMAGIYDYAQFWEGLEVPTITRGEHQVINGFKGLKTVRLSFFHWYDTGNEEAYQKTLEAFPNKLVATKTSEALFLDNKKIIKYNEDPSTAFRLIQRSKNLACLPRYKETASPHLISYHYIEGQTLAANYSDSEFSGFLDFCQRELFSKTFPSTDSFKEDCRRMYKIKTQTRSSQFIDSELDKITTINGVEVQPLAAILAKINWEEIIASAIPAKFHGDLQPENVITNSSPQLPSLKVVTLIDPRPTFGHSLEVGDVYYDLSKLYHGLLINGQTVLSKGYQVKITDSAAELQYIIKNNLASFEQIFKRFCEAHSYDFRQVRILAALHFLNIASLYENFHNGEYKNFLFLLAKYLLTTYL